ncbi:MAG TPA: response regulator [Flavisolibacter sp.]|jgi:CheY-like chemotaxis protein|nr:response regulator [Flavisolibacter sp.]
MEKSSPYMNNVVLADDDKDHGYLFRMILRQVDPSKSVTIVKDGAQLIDFLKKQVPDLLFLDLNMPCKGGLECLREIRKELNLKDLPIVVYSSSTHMTDIQKSYLHEADLYMVKPFNSIHLKNALDSILKMDWRNNLHEQRYYFMNNRFVPFTA